MIDINSLTREDFRIYRNIFLIYTDYTPEWHKSQLLFFIELNRIYGRKRYEVLTVPFDEIPLYIGGDPIACKLAKWRLVIGK